MSTAVAAPATGLARGTAFILLASVAFGSSGPLAKPVMQAGVSPVQVAALRAGIAALALLAVVGLWRPQVLRVRRGQWPLLVAYGLTGVAAVQALFFVAVQRLPVGVAMLLEYTSPVLVALWVRFVRGVRLKALSWIGTGFAFIGLILVAQVWQGLRMDVVGLVAGVGAAVCSAGYYLLGERGAGEHHPIGMVTWGMVIGAAGLLVVSDPWSIPLEAFGQAVPFGPWAVPVWPLVVAVSLLSTALAYSLSISSLRYLPSTVASVLALTEPVVATLLAWVLLREVLSGAQLAGMCVLLTGAALVQIAARGPVNPAEPIPTDRGIKHPISHSSE